MIKTENVTVCQPLAHYISKKHHILYNNIKIHLLFGCYGCIAIFISNHPAVGNTELLSDIAHSLSLAHMDIGAGSIYYSCHCYANILRLWLFLRNVLARNEFSFFTTQRVYALLWFVHLRNNAIFRFEYLYSRDPSKHLHDLFRVTKAHRLSKTT